MRLVEVSLGERSYKVAIAGDAFSACADFIAGGGYSAKALLVTDEMVDGLYAGAFLRELEKTPLSIAKIAVTVGEEAKSLAWAEKIYTVAIEHGLDRKSPIIALGGGVVGDLAGFIAATYMRGVPFIQAPTTLLAQTDSSVGGKVAVNHPAGKNMIGAFYQPDAVFASTDVLRTLSARDYASGLAEVVKYACLAGEEWLEFLTVNIESVLKRDSGVLEEIVARCCQYKSDIVAEDEKESGKRMWLNLGHTYGHAVEAAGGFSLYTHGEAVAIGLNGALLLSEAMGFALADKREQVCGLLSSLGLPVQAKGLSADKVYKNLLHDKKALDSNLRWVLLEKIGAPMVSQDVPIDVVRQVAGKILR